MLAAVATLAPLAPFAGAQSVKNPGISIAALLDLYEQKDYDAVRDAAGRIEDHERFAREFVATADRWVQAKGQGSVQRRRLIASTIVLEVASAFVDEEDESRAVKADTDIRRIREAVEQRQRQWISLRALIEWGCGSLRSSAPPTPEEALWFLVSFELVQPRDPMFLYGPPADTSPERLRETRNQYGPSLNHVSHGFSRFPDNKSFELLTAEGHNGSWVWGEVANWVTRGDGVSPREFKDLQGQARIFEVENNAGRFHDAPVDLRPVFRARFLTVLSEIRRRIEPLAAFLETSARAHLDLGAIALVFKDPDGAIDHFGEVSTRADHAGLKFAGHFLQGWLHARAGRNAAAENGFRSAHALRPNAQSATVALAEILFTSGRRTEATALIDTSIASATETPGLRPTDPGLEIFSYGRVSSPSSLSQLRQAVTK